MAYTDINDKALGFAQSGIRERTGQTYLERKKVEEHQAEADRLRAELQQEEAILLDMHENINRWQQEKDSLQGLIDLLKKPRNDFETLSDEEFEARRKQLRWEIADVLGKYTFIVNGIEEIQGGF